MVSIEKYMVDATELQNEIKRRNDEAESNRPIQFIEARKIQAWFRGIVTRNHFRELHRMATTIQRHWRGYQARLFVEDYLIQRVCERWRKYHDDMAIRIQAIWRGYRERKNGVDLRKMRQWLQFVYSKNAQALEQMKKFRDTELEYTRNVMEGESMIWILFILFKLHHLLRTQNRPGVLTRVDKTRFTVIEEMLRCLEYTLYEARKRRKVCNQQSATAVLPLLFEGTYFERCEKEIRELEKSLKTGNVPIFRSQAYGEEEKMLKEVKRLGEELLGKYSDKGEFTTVTKTHCVHDNTVRVTMDNYRSSPKDTFPSIRPPRDKSKELNGDFKLIVKSNELWEAIRKMDCAFNLLRAKCPIHDLESYCDM